MQLTDKLQHLIMMAQLHSAPQPNEKQVHKTMQAYMNTLHVTQRKSNLTVTMLQDISTFYGQDSQS